MMIVRKMFCFLYVVLIACVVSFGHARVGIAAEGRDISLGFKNADIHVLIRFLGELTGKNFIIDNRVSGSVTVYSSTKMNVTEAYRVFESILKVNKFVIVPSGGAYKILPMTLAKSEALSPINLHNVSDGNVSKGNGLETQILRLHHSSAIELFRVIKKVMGSNGVVAAYAPGNLLIVTAPYLVNLQILKLIQSLDKEKLSPQVKHFPLQFGDAKSVALRINRIVEVQVKKQVKLGKKSIAFVLADERINAIVALADPETMQLVESLVSILDIPTPKGKGCIHMLFLENAKAEDVAKMVNTLVERQGGTTGQNFFSRDVTVVADKATNSLIITARPPDLDILMGIITRLDLPRKQVFIEAAIMEASSDSSFNFGVNWAGALGGGNTRLIGSSNHGGGSISVPENSTSGFVGFPSGSSIGAVMTDAFNVGGTSYSIQSILSAVKGNNAFTLLSTPQLLTLNNEEARIDIVDNIPFVKQSVVTTATSISTQSVDYKDVGVKLKITPRIGVNGQLLLNVNQEVSRVVNSLITLEQGQSILAPTTRKREVETTIRMVDGQTAVIAGLLTDDDSDNNSSTPWLGEIPVLGWLFKQKKKSSVKTNLYIFISARIINTLEETERLAREKKQKFFSFRVGGGGSAPIMSEPRLLQPVMILR